MKAIELLKRYKLVELAVLYSQHKHCRARDKMLKVCAENLKDIIDEDSYVEIMARMIKAANKFLDYKIKCYLYEDVLVRLDAGVRKTATLLNSRRLFRGGKGINL